VHALGNPFDGCHVHSPRCGNGGLPAALQQWARPDALLWDCEGSLTTPRAVKKLSCGTHHHIVQRHGRQRAD
jgi:hypothetical protein